VVAAVLAVFFGFFAGVLFFYGGPGRCLVGMCCDEGLRDYTMGWLYDCMIFGRSVGCIYLEPYVCSSFLKSHQLEYLPLEFTAVELSLHDY
jgi:hypothetical protein